MAKVRRTIFPPKLVNNADQGPKSKLTLSDHKINNNNMVNFRIF